MLDTPTRAVKCGRPRTRGWSDLLEAAKSDEDEAVRLRAELNRYLEEADNFSKRRAARKEARAVLLKEASAAASSPRPKITRTLSSSPLAPAASSSSNLRSDNDNNDDIVSNVSISPLPPASTPAKPPLPSATPVGEQASLPAAQPTQVQSIPQPTPPRKAAAAKPAPSNSTPPPSDKSTQKEDLSSPSPTTKSSSVPDSTSAKKRSVQDKSTQKKAPSSPSPTIKSSLVPDSSSAKKQSVQDDGVDFEDLSHESVNNLCKIIATLSSPWTKRVSALRALSSKEDLSVDSTLTKALCVQLADLRSKVVVDASRTIEAHSPRLAVDDALYIVSKALGCVAVKKAVMADARETAAIKALAPLYDENTAWAAVLDHAKKQPAERSRLVVVKAVSAWLGPMGKERDAQLAELFNSCLVDKSGNVRDAGKTMYKEYVKKANKKRVAALKELLSAAATKKLPKSGASKHKSKKTGGKPKLNMKEEIRRKREALKEGKKKEDEGDNDDDDDNTEKKDTIRKGFRVAASEENRTRSKAAAPITTRDPNRDKKKNTVAATFEPAIKKKKLNSARASPSVLANKENNKNDSNNE